MSDTEWKKEYVINRRLLRSSEAETLKKTHFPLMLYKYRSCCDNYALENFDNDTIWMNTAANFNDPFDSCFSYSLDDIIEDAIGKDAFEYVISKNGIDGIELTEDEIYALRHRPYKEMIKYLLEKNSGYLALFEQICDRHMQCKLSPDYQERALSHIRDLQECLSVCCFSETPGSILMWSHYADYHKGFCLGYDFRDTELQSEFEPVIYSEDMYDATSVILGDISNINPFWMKYTAMRKHIDWAYEREWRLIKFAWEQDNSKYALSIPQPKVIYLGCKIDERNKDKLIDAAKAKSMEIYQMKMDEKKFMLNPIKI